MILIIIPSFSPWWKRNRFDTKFWIRPNENRHTSSPRHFTSMPPTFPKTALNEDSTDIQFAFIGLSYRWNRGFLLNHHHHGEIDSMLQNSQNNTYAHQLCPSCFRLNYSRIIVLVQSVGEKFIFRVGVKTFAWELKRGKFPRVGVKIFSRGE